MVENQKGKNDFVHLQKMYMLQQLSLLFGSSNKRNDIILVPIFHPQKSTYLVHFHPLIFFVQKHNICG